MKKLPPMRQKMMPDIFPSLFGFEVGIHMNLIKKIPRKLLYSRRILEDFF